MLQSLWRRQSDAIRADRQERVIRHAARAVFQDPDFISFMSLLTRFVAAVRGPLPVSKTHLLPHLYQQPDVLCNLRSPGES